jgi:hypothetical protein
MSVAQLCASMNVARLRVGTSTSTNLPLQGVGFDDGGGRILGKQHIDVFVECCIGAGWT